MPIIIIINRLYRRIAGVLAVYTYMAQKWRWLAL